MSTSQSIVAKVWNFCNILRDAGVSYGDYLEQLTFLIFLKMADEYAKPPHNRDLGIPAEYTWQSLKAKRGDQLEVHYIKLLRELGKKKGMLGKIFIKAQNKIQDPAMLSRVIEMIDNEDWVSMSADVKGDIYEGLLEKKLSDTPPSPQTATDSDRNIHPPTMQAFSKVLDNWDTSLGGKEIPLLTGKILMTTLRVF
ncbi:type I restriction-modification system subunit M N-terminal domain-containing protein [Nostoc flagelliforme]|uniref:type I restriction-modification system subunit M N-terminal domain-containing protein n=1 Tax=Nostoc flagelliforme TaxID=1306274 RepID=UPI0018F00576|nr:type I restriction-modification system subunit M N-terminal domain-containing protein [Nostoc flagelliforme]